jgi:hypothetical protein
VAFAREVWDSRVIASPELEPLKTQVSEPSQAQPQATVPELSARAFAPPGALSATQVLALQRSAGNQSVMRMLSRASAGSLHRCPDGSCGGTCMDEDEEAARERKSAEGTLRAKELGGGPESLRGSGEAPAEVVEDLEGDEDETEAGDREGEPATEAEPGGPVDTGAREKREEHVEVSLTLVAPGPVRAGTGHELRSKASTSVKSGAPASQALAATSYGLTMEESVEVTVSAKKVGNAWQPVVKKLVGRYSQQVRLLGGQSEVTGPAGNTTQANFCDQVTGLDTLGNTVGNIWYMLQAVKDHEDVHAKHFGPGLKAAAPTITAAIEAVSTPDVAGMKKAGAVTALRADAAFLAAVQAARLTWSAQDDILLVGDHAAGGPCEKAEHKVVDPMTKRICKHAKKQKWAACPACPP